MTARQAPRHPSAPPGDGLAPAAGEPKRGTALILAAVVLVAANLRLGVSATGALLGPLTTGLHLGTAAAAFLPALWALTFSAGGFAGAPLARRFGTDRVLTASLFTLFAGTLLRAVPAQAALLGGSLVAGLGIALANVLLPAITRAYFPTRIGLVTGLYGTALTAGAACAALVAVPVADALGSPEHGLAIWAAPCAAAVFTWIAARRGRGAPRREDAGARPPRTGDVSLRTLTRSKLAWAMALLFGLQSAGAYVVMGYLPSVFEQAGMSAGRAGALMSASFFLGIPVSFAVPLLGARLRDQRILMAGLSGAFCAAFAGLALTPASPAWLWIVLLAIGMSTFQLVLALFGLRAGTAGGTAALSAFAQAVGYLIAAFAPFAVGLLHRATGTWTAPLLGMAAVALGQGLVGLYVASGRRGTVEPKG